MPVLLRQSHWCLIWVDIHGKKYRFFDQINVNNDKEYFSVIINYLRFYSSFRNQKIDLTDWSIIQIDAKIPEQIDSPNCGVFVLFYAFYLLKREKDFSLDTSKYRKKLARFILENAPIIRHLCGICGRDEF